MNAIEIYENANRKLNKGEITLGEYERVIDPLRNVIPISEGATNGDMIKAMFGITDNDIDEGLSTTYVYTKTRVLKGGSQDYLRERITFNREWWNAPYKKESED